VVALAPITEPEAWMLAAEVILERHLLVSVTPRVGKRILRAAGTMDAADRGITAVAIAATCDARTVGLDVLLGCVARRLNDCFGPMQSVPMPPQPNLPEPVEFDLSSARWMLALGKANDFEAYWAFRTPIIAAVREAWSQVEALAPNLCGTGGDPELVAAVLVEHALARR
jgi:hypothetical protein